MRGGDRNGPARIPAEKDGVPLSVGSAYTGSQRTGACRGAVAEKRAFSAFAVERGGPVSVGERGGGCDYGGDSGAVQGSRWKQVKMEGAAATAAAPSI